MAIPSMNGVRLDAERVNVERATGACRAVVLAFNCYIRIAYCSLMRVCLAGKL